MPKLPGGGTRVFGKHRFLVAYYGTAGTGSLGVLGETAPDEMHRRLRRAAQPFLLEGERIQTVYELIVTVADPIAGPDGDFSHDIAADSVRAYIEAAHRNGALVVLDIQPGRADFLTVAKRWAWALADPWVGLALDPEWRMGPRQVPGRVIGSVGATEVNQVSAWLADLVEREGLPEKAFVLHQFRSTMIRDDRAGPDAGRPGDGAARRRVREPGPEARDVPRGRAPGSVRDGLQAVLRRGREPLQPRPGPHDPAHGALRVLPVSRV